MEKMENKVVKKTWEEIEERLIKAQIKACEKLKETNQFEQADSYK